MAAAAPVAAAAAAPRCLHHLQMRATWLNDQYLALEAAPDSPSGLALALRHVWWLDVGGTLHGVCVDACCLMQALLHMYGCHPQTSTLLRTLCNCNLLLATPACNLLLATPACNLLLQLLQAYRQANGTLFGLLT